MISFDLNMDFVLCASKVKRGLLRDVIMRGGGGGGTCTLFLGQGLQEYQVLVLLPQWASP